MQWPGECVKDVQPAVFFFTMALATTNQHSVSMLWSAPPLSGTPSCLSPCATFTAMEGNVGNDCAEHAAAIGVLGLVSSHNILVRWPPPRCHTAPKRPVPRASFLHHLLVSNFPSSVGFYLLPLVQHVLCRVAQVELWCPVRTVPSMANTSTYSSTRTTWSSKSDVEEHNVWNNVLGHCFIFHVARYLKIYVVSLRPRHSSRQELSATWVLLRLPTAATRQPSIVLSEGAIASHGRGTFALGLFVRGSFRLWFGRH